MLRTSQELDSNTDLQGYSVKAVKPSIETDAIANRPNRQIEAAWRDIPEQEQSRIYRDWIGMLVPSYNSLYTGTNIF